MSDGPTGDPIFPDQPVIAPANGHPAHEQDRESVSDWVVVHRGGAGSKAHVEALGRELIKAHIPHRIEHDDEHRVVLEVPRDRKTEAAQVLGDRNTSGAGASVHEPREERIEREERAQLTGAFRAATWKWLLIVLAIGVLGVLAFWFIR